jgi:hypothetical protein
MKTAMGNRGPSKLHISNIPKYSICLPGASGWIHKSLPCQLNSRTHDGLHSWTFLSFDCGTGIVRGLLRRERMGSPIQGVSMSTSDKQPPIIIGVYRSTANFSCDTFLRRVHLIYSDHMSPHITCSSMLARLYCRDITRFDAFYPNPYTHRLPAFCSIVGRHSKFPQYHNGWS